MIHTGVVGFQWAPRDAYGFRRVSKGFAGDRRLGACSTIILRKTILIIKAP